MNSDFGMSVLQALPFPVLVVAGERRVEFANGTAEAVLGTSLQVLRKARLDHFLPYASPILALIDLAKAERKSIVERRLPVQLAPDQEERLFDVFIEPMMGETDTTLVILMEQTIVDRLDRQLMSRKSSSSVSTLSAMLAHEIKNPLSGISGAAQLLDASLPAADRPLARLIKEETDRIVRIVDRMEVFSDSRPLALAPINVHAVLTHVKNIAMSGFAKNITFTEIYDPSLPFALANRDRLVQVFLNLVKNAAEALGPETRSPEITLTTAFRPGVRLSGPAVRERKSLPLEIGVHDNGGGIPPDLMPRLFDPFVTTKPNGSGLGLALVAKIVADHGGSIVCESKPRKTSFLVYLPIGQADDARGATE